MVAVTITCDGECTIEIVLNFSPANKSSSYDFGIIRCAKNLIASFKQSGLRWSSALRTIPHLSPLPLLKREASLSDGTPPIRTKMAAKSASPRVFEERIEVRGCFTSPLLRIPHPSPLPLPKREASLTDATLASELERANPPLPVFGERIEVRGWLSAPSLKNRAEVFSGPRCTLSLSRGT
jgi:hypothetical protein